MCCNNCLQSIFMPSALHMFQAQEVYTLNVSLKWCKGPRVHQPGQIKGTSTAIRVLFGAAKGLAEKDYYSKRGCKQVSNSFSSCFENYALVSLQIWQICCGSAQGHWGGSKFQCKMKLLSGITSLKINANGGLNAHMLHLYFWIPVILYGNK